MDEWKKKVRASRLLLQDPYAHIEELEDSFETARYENPYRFLSQAEKGYSPQEVLTTESIERAAQSLQRDIWIRRTNLGFNAAAHPLEVLDPKLAADFLGFELSMVPSLGWMSHGRDQVKAAGIIDREHRTIRIATDIEPKVMRFTAAHEIGHAILHPHLSGVHRDRPLSGINRTRDRVEWEADKFASFFLMPGKLLIEEFRARFLDVFSLNEDSSFALLGKPLHEVSSALSSTRQVSRKLAGATYFNGRHFVSLADAFGVSIETMAIRLEELGLIAR